MKRWQKVGIGACVAIMILVCLGVLALSGLQGWMYPVAPPMPAAVSEPLPQILSRLDDLLKTKAPAVSALLQPGLSAADISKLAGQYHVQLPPDISMIYQWHDGAGTTTNDVSMDFIPGHRFLSLEEALAERALAKNGTSWLQRLAYRTLVGHRESWVCLFSDGAGDGYWYDLKRTPAEGAVFYNFQETATYTFFPSPRNLLAGVAACYQQGAFHLKAGASPPQLEEDYGQSAKIWSGFGVTKE